MGHKICTTCGTEKLLEDFSWKNKARGKRHSRCKICTRKAIHQHYIDNRALYLQRTRESNNRNRRRNRLLLLEYWKDHPCVDCDESDPACLQFDHVRGHKKLAISRMMHYDPKHLLEEIKKCDVRCANCHMKKTAKQQRWFSCSNGLVV